MLSIVMPTYNSEQFINETLCSIYNQTSSDYELLIVDGGSTDRTLDILKKFDDAKIKIISRGDTGIANALNKGFAAARGDVFCWLNSNDVYVSRYVVESVNSYFLLTRAEFVSGISYSLDEEGKIMKKQYPFASLSNPAANFGNLFTGSLFFSRRAWQNFEGFSERFRFAFEYELIQYLLDTYRFRYILQPIAGFRAHTDALSNINKTEMRQEKHFILKSRNSSMNWNLLSSRIAFHILHGELAEVVFNAIRTTKKGRDWRDLFDAFSPLV